MGDSRSIDVEDSTKIHNNNDIIINGRDFVVTSIGFIYFSLYFSLYFQENQKQHYSRHRISKQH